MSKKIYDVRVSEITGWPQQCRLCGRPLLTPGEECQCRFEIPSQIDFLGYLASIKKIRKKDAESIRASADEEE